MRAAEAQVTSPRRGRRDRRRGNPGRRPRRNRADLGREPAVRRGSDAGRAADRRSGRASGGRGDPRVAAARSPRVARGRHPGAAIGVSWTVTNPQEVDMPEIRERLSLLWLFALLNYLYADVIALFAIVGSPNLSEAPHLPGWALMGSAVLMEIPIAMILASRFLPFKANRLANIIAGIFLTLINASLTYLPPLFGARTPALPEYLFLATIETVATSVIVWQAWTWSEVETVRMSA